jgi:Holliday junction resolvase RusA-like endonuclease
VCGMSVLDSNTGGVGPASHDVRSSNELIMATFPFPVSVNKLYVDTINGRVLTKEGRQYKITIHEALQEQRLFQRHCPDPPFELAVWIMVPDRRRRDTTNFVKALEDAVATYFHYDDSCHHVVTMYKAIDRTNPRAVILLERKTEPIPEPPDHWLERAKRERRY